MKRAGKENWETINWELLYEDSGGSGSYDLLEGADSDLDYGGCSKDMGELKEAEKKS